MPMSPKSQALPAENGNPYYSGPAGDHFDGMRFFNPDGVEPGGFGKLLRWQFGGGRVRWPGHAPSPFPPTVPEARVRGLRVTMVNHATLLVQAAGLNVLTDPVWSKRVSPFGFAGPARHNAPGVRFADLPPIDAVLVSHNHYDHLDLATLAMLHERHDPLVVTPLGNDTIIRTRVPRMRLAALDWGEQAAVGDARAHLVPVHHWSARWTRDRRMALWGGFVLESAAGSVFFAGDTGFDGGRPYRRLAERFPRLRLALLPIGAYEPRWFMAPQHQDPAQAVEGFRLCGAAYAAGIHWGTFQLTNEGPHDPRDALFASLDAAGIERARFRPLHPGEVWDVPAE
jgi:L-ascorbate metabolism protein UlaG (beta-lactamase superfamily)